MQRDDPPFRDRLATVDTRGGILDVRHVRRRSDLNLCAKRREPWVKIEHGPLETRKPQPGKTFDQGFLVRPELFAPGLLIRSRPPFVSRSSRIFSADLSVTSTARASCSRVDSGFRAVEEKVRSMSEEGPLSCSTILAGNARDPGKRSIRSHAPAGRQVNLPSCPVLLV